MSVVAVDGVPGGGGGGGGGGMVFHYDIIICCLEIPWVSGFDQSFGSCRCQKSYLQGSAL